MKKLLLVLAGTASLGLVACNGGSSNPSNNTLYNVSGAQLTANTNVGGCSIPSGSSNAINCPLNNGVGYSGNFTYTFTSSTPGSFLDLGTAQTNAANNNLSNVTLSPVAGSNCATAMTGQYSCNFQIQGAAGSNTGTFQIPLNGSLGAQSYITVTVQ